MRPYDVVGFSPADTGTVLCVGCAEDRDLNINDCDVGSPIFADSEWEGASTCEDCDEELEINDMGIVNDVIKAAEGDRVGKVVLAAWRAAEAALKERGENNDVNIDDLVMSWARKIRLAGSGGKEHIVVCEIEVTGDTSMEAAQDACDLMYKALNEDTGLYFTIQTRVGTSMAKICPRRVNWNGRLLADKGITVTENGDVFAGLPEIHVADYDDKADHVREATHATLNLKTLLESLSDEQLRAHVEWRTPDADLGRNVDKARGARGDNARQRPRMPPR